MILLDPKASHLAFERISIFGKERHVQVQLQSINIS